jgi:tetratricopeptide (TPR) repeat protein
MTIATIVGLILTGVGLVGIFFLVIKKIPTLIKLQEIQVASQIGLGERLRARIKGIRYSTYRPKALEWLEKNLRKFRVLILKIDNLFIDLIKRSRERSQVWQIRSGAWREYMHLKKKEKLQVLETLDKAEVSETLEKINQEVAKDEDVAFKEKVETIANGNGTKVEASEPSVPTSSEVTEEVPVTDEEKKYIDLIAANPKDANAYRALGFLYLNQKNYSDARACFRRVLKFNPQDEEVKNKLNEIKGLKGKNI